MLTESLDRDTIFSRAIEIASAEERAAYLARACGHDDALRRQVEKMVAAHFQAASLEKPTSNGTSHQAGHNLGPAAANHGKTTEHAPSAVPHAEKGARKHSRGLKAATALLLAAVVASTAWALWASRGERQAHAEARQAAEERDQARKAEAETKQQRDRALVARQSLSAERDRALESVKAAQNLEQDAKAVLTFLQNNMLSAGRPMGWGVVGPGKEMTLRKAVQTAEAKVAAMFADRPLVEASIRVALGSAYLDLGEAVEAVKQLKRALELREVWLGSDHPDTGDCRNLLAVALRHADRIGEASGLFEQGADSSSHADALAGRGAILLSQKKPVEAELKLRECLNIRQKIQPDDWATFDTKSLLGEALLEQKKYTDAEPLLLAGYEGLKKREAKIPSHDKAHVAKALERLKQLYEAWGQKDKAARWQEELESMKKT